MNYHHCLEINDEQAAFLALKLMNEQLTHLVSTGNHHYWPWIIVTLHNALQGFMVLALKGSSSLNVMTKKSAEAWLEADRSRDRKFSEKKLDNFTDLYQKIKSSSFRRNVNSKIFIPNKTQDENVKKLNELRNNFIHFVPGEWQISINYLKPIVEDCIDIICFLAFYCGNIMWEICTLNKEEVKILLEESKNNISRIAK